MRVPYSPHDKSVAKRIIRIEVEFAPANDRGRAADFGNDRRISTECCLLYDFHSHRAAQNALDRHLFVDPQFTLGVMESRPSAHTRSRRRAIKLAVGKDADITAVVPGIQCRTDKDGTVKEAQITFVWMGDRVSVHNRMFDPPAIVNQTGEIFRTQLQIQWLDFNDRVERAAVSDIE